MSAFTVYYDASGHQEHGECISFAGVVARESRWLRFEDEWGDVLELFQVPYLHMTDLEYFHGPYRKWRDAPDKKNRFLGALLNVLKRCQNIHFAVAVMLDDFDFVNKHFRLAEGIGGDHPRAGAYAFAADTCMQWVKHWLSQKRGQHHVLHVFEDGDYGKGAFIRALKEYHPQSTYQFQPKKKAGGRVRALEAADLVGYASRVHLKHRARGKWTNHRLIGALGDHIPHRIAYFVTENMLKMCLDHPDLTPPRGDLSTVDWRKEFYPPEENQG